jgi:hypothetical protein
VILILLLLNTPGWADLEALMKAKTSAQVEAVHQQDIQQRVLKERCNIEMKQGWIPLSCFEWLNRSSPTQGSHSKLLALFNRSCLSSLETNPPLPKKPIFKHITPGRCLEGVQRYYLDQSYISTAGRSMEDLMTSADIGKDIVTEFGHAPEKKRQNKQLQRRGVLR